MAKYNKSYWEKRQERKYLAGEKKINDYYRGLKKSFEQAKKEIQSVINDFYWRYAEENQLSFASAQISLNKMELGELKDFIKKAYENMGKYNLELNNMSIRARITRYQALEKQIDAILQQLYAIEYEYKGKDLLKKVYEDSYYRTWFNIDQYRGFHQEFAQINPITIDELIRYPFNGADFSSRIWKQKDHMLQVLTEDITTMLIQGRNPQTLAGDFAKRFKTKEYEAYRLLHTESSFIIEQGTLAAYKEDGVKKYQILATLDMKTSDICRSEDGEIYDVDKAVVGVNYPPYHPFCRTTTVPYYEDVENEGTRAARGADGKTYYVPSSMKYADWKKAFVDGGSKDGLKEISINRFSEIYKNWDGIDIREFAANLLKQENLPLTVQRHPLIGANGQCQLNYKKPEMEILSYELNSNDIRSIEYQIKTAFHELFHAKSNGLNHDIGEISFKDWAYVDDIFAEAAAHYITKSIGITNEIAPSYAEHLVQSLPKLKQLPEFSSCKTIADFGEVVYKYRFGNELNAKWKPIVDVLNNSKYDIIEYSKKYIDYIKNNKEELVDKLLENMPNFSAYKNNMLDDIDRAIETLKNGYYLSGNEKLIFEDALIITMNRLGVE